jgi:hypothetical protein
MSTTHGASETSELNCNQESNLAQVELNEEKVWSPFILRSLFRGPTHSYTSALALQLIHISPPCAAAMKPTSRGRGGGASCVGRG